MAIDWSMPIEAVGDDGTIVAVNLVENDGSDLPMRIEPYLPIPSSRSEAAWFKADGTRDSGFWRIRNVQPTTDPIKDRMIALIRELAGEPQCGEVWERNKEFCAYTDRAQEIMAEIDGPKTDEEWAGQIAADHGCAQAWAKPVALSGIERGRILEREKNNNR